LSDADIRGLIEAGELVIDPLSPDTVRENGVDLRFSKRFCVMRGGGVLDTRGSGEPRSFYDCVEAEDYVIPPGARVLAVTEEWVELPPYLVGLVNLRSSFARLGLYVPPTVVDAGFKGRLVIELVGSTVPVRVYSGQRFLHLILLTTTSEVRKTYQGRYQGQRDVQLPILPIE